MNVVDIMTEKPVTIHLDSTLCDALETMASVNCHHLPVVGSNGHLVGVISERDCRIALNTPQAVHECWRNHVQANELLVRNVMTPAPIVVEPNTPAVEAARLMLINHIGCLPVMRSETLIGIITKSDILMAFMNIYKRINRIENQGDGQKSVRPS